MKGAIEIRGVVSTLVKHENTSVQRILPKKCQDPGIFVVPCTIGDRTFTNAMLDLGASINIMLVSIYRSLNLGDLEPIGMVIQLVNRSVVKPLGVLEDILVQVNELIFPVDFYVLDMEDKASEEGSALILGRSFLMMARTKIDVHAGILSMEFGNTFVKFNIFEALKHPAEDHSIFNIGAIEGLIEEYARMSTDSANLVNFVDISDVINKFCTKVAKADFEMLSHVLPFSYSEDFISNKIHCKIDEVPKISQNDEFPILKPLPKHLKYAYLRDNQQFSKLLEVLTKHKKVIGWTLSDLPRMNPSICMHKILLEEDARPVRQQQRRLNLTLLDVVKKEVTNLLRVRIIYPISDSQWVSSVQVVPKKSRMMVIKNRQDEMVSAKI
ncbi:hypothetical protein CR513_44481, partial [Mucuna pruriens]